MECYVLPVLLSSQVRKFISYLHYANWLIVLKYYEGVYKELEHLIYKVMYADNVATRFIYLLFWFCKDYLFFNTICTTHSLAKYNS